MTLLLATTNFLVVFDVAQAGYRQWWLPACGLIGVALGLGLHWLMLKGVLKADDATRKLVLRFVFGFSAFWIVGQFGLTFWDYWQERTALTSGQATVTEGVVTNFIPMTDKLHAMESFTVQGKTFAYSDEAEVAGFNQTARRGGPIREGEYVKIWSKGKSILRVEVEKKS